MERQIKLSGGEISILKTIGLGGTAMRGKLLMEKLGEIEESEFLDDLSGLISLGYLLSDKVNLFKSEDVERANLRVNASYARDLRDALNPGRHREQERRRRRRG